RELLAKSTPKPKPAVRKRAPRKVAAAA
ncbi:MAG: hypothetical protein QOJ07_3186, partial [Thermoleophilaceae bacterium]|nr:hypothetical protein [Thermoleophilaceae bacterium]